MYKHEIPQLSYNAMFKAVFSNNKEELTKLVEAILNYLKINIPINSKDLIIKNNELPLKDYKSKQLICDYLIKLDDNFDLNVEINNSNYPGLIERNLTYSFKIFYEHFKSGDKNLEYSKYNMLQINFNNFKNYNHKTINKYYIINADDVSNFLSQNLCIINIDIESCFNLVYNSTKLTDVSLLERFAAILYCKTIEDISFILGGDILDMEEKERFLADIKVRASDKDVLEDLSLEKDIEYRFYLVEIDAFERGKNEGIEQNALEMLKNMLQNNIDTNTISKVTNKSIDEINDIKNNLN